MPLTAAAPQTFINTTGKSKRADSSFELSDGRSLEVKTYKHSRGGVVSYAQVGKSEDGLFRFMVFSDFNKVLKHSDVRVTAKAVENQHSEVLSFINDEFLDEIELYYATKEGAVA